MPKQSGDKSPQSKKKLSLRAIQHSEIAMNEHVGFITCPNCDAPWNDEQWACPYCHNTEKPAAMRAPGPTWAWLLAGAVLFLAAAVDLSFGGHGCRTVLQWLKTTN